MGREIRRVPPGWQHPKENKPRFNFRTGGYTMETDYIPLFNFSFEERALEWQEGLLSWLEGKLKAQLAADFDEAAMPRTVAGYSEYEGDFPDRETYMPEWTDDECTAYQIYENVSEGTPVSPVFETEDEMRDWLVSQGHSLHAANEFIRQGWVFSFMAYRGEIKANIDAFDIIP